MMESASGISGGETSSTVVESTPPGMSKPTASVSIEGPSAMFNTSLIGALSLMRMRSARPSSLSPEKTINSAMRAAGVGPYA